MKNTSILLFLLINSLAISQIVDIPDANFKNALVNTLCVASGYQENPEWDADVNNDGEIQVSEAEAIVHLVIGGQNIDSLEGIGAFIGLKSLRCSLNNITELDLSNSPDFENLSCGHNLISTLNVTQNPNLVYVYIDSNNLSELDVTQNTNLEDLICYNNSIQNLDLTQNNNLTYLQAGKNELSSIDISQNVNLLVCQLSENNLSEIDVSQNIHLLDLSIAHNNLTTIELSLNQDLRQLTCLDNSLTGNLDLSQNEELYSLYCTNTLLTNIDIRNGNNINVIRMWAQDNPNLTCVQVDDIDFANSQFCDPPSSGWCKDESAVYSEDCNLGLEDVLENQISIYPNPAKDILYIYNESVFDISTIKVYDALGRLVLEQNNPSNQIDISTLFNGLLFIQIETDKGNLVKKLIKE